MSYVPPTKHEVEIMRVKSRVHRYEHIAALAYTAGTREWAEKKANQARAELKRLLEEKP